MRWSLGLVIACALLLRPTAAAACDPDWDWCGYDWYEPTWYEPPVYEPAPVYYDPAPVYYEPAPVYYEPAPVYYEPAPVYYEPPPVYEPAPYPYEPVPVYEPPVPVYEPPVPVYEPPAYEPTPFYDPPAYEPPLVSSWTPEPAPVPPPPPPWSAPASDDLAASSAPPPAPAPPVGSTPDEIAALYGLHAVNQVWAGNVVTTTGLATTYSTATESFDPGTRAKLVARVGTGEASAYDALLSTGRMALSDGRPVKGDVYASYVWNVNDWVVDRYVFFQDDLEIARLASPSPAPAATVTPPTPAPPTGAPVAPVVAPVAPVVAPVVASFAPVIAPSPVAVAAPAVVVPVGPVVAPVPGQPQATVIGPAFVAPTFEDPASARPGSQPSPSSARPAPRVVVAGIALGPQADLLGRIEVLRGRRIALWIRATVDGTPARVVTWRLVSGDLTALGPISGSGDDPLVATWRTIPTAGAPITVWIRATIDVVAEGPREADAILEVVVRSPALVDP